MSQKDIERFFDRLSDKWDEMEEIEDKDIIPLLNEVGIKEGDEILDLGCGTGRITSLLHMYSNDDVYGLDISKKMIDVAKKKYEGKEFAHFQAGDFFSYTENNGYDVIIIYNAYPHFINKDAFKESLKRNLKINGKFAIIHSISRQKLGKVHNDMEEKITRTLDDPLTEANFFNDSFKINTAKEDDHSFLIIGTKI